MKQTSRLARGRHSWHDFFLGPLVIIFQKIVEKPEIIEIDSLINKISIIDTLDDIADTLNQQLNTDKLN